MIIVSNFELKYNEEKGIYTIISLMSCKCPLCGGAVYHRDHKNRDVKRRNGEVWHFRLRRLLCDDCEKLHSEIPDIIQPFKHYDSDTIQSVLDGSEKAKDCLADDSTMNRWKSEFKMADTDIEQRLASVYVREADEKAPVLSSITMLACIRATVERWLAFVMRLLINAGHKLCTQFAFCHPHCFDKIKNAGNNNVGGRETSDKTIADTG